MSARRRHGRRSPLGEATPSAEEPAPDRRGPRGPELPSEQVGPPPDALPRSGAEAWPDESPRRRGETGLAQAPETRPPSEREAPGLSVGPAARSERAVRVGEHDERASYDYAVDTLDLGVARDVSDPLELSGRYNVFSLVSITGGTVYVRFGSTSADRLPLSDPLVRTRAFDRVYLDWAVSAGDSAVILRDWSFV